MDGEVLSRPKGDLYAAITGKIVEAIEKGTGEFVMPWHRQSPELARPRNALTGKPYRGVNVVSLWANASLAGYGSGLWASYRQWRVLGAQVRQAERGTMIVFYKPIEPSPDEDTEANRPRSIACTSYVFNADQVTGWRPPPQQARAPVASLEHVEVFIGATKALVNHGGDVARYKIAEDVIELPLRDQFKGEAAMEIYYAVLLHELIHWSGASHRLARDLGQRFGSNAYAMEELVAELGAAFLCATLGVTNEPRLEHAVYVASWLEALKRDSKAIFVAAGKASQAAEYLKQLAVDNLVP
jgi:antirestriction protein ArdC